MILTSVSPFILKRGARLPPGSGARNRLFCRNKLADQIEGDTAMATATTLAADKLTRFAAAIIAACGSDKAEADEVSKPISRAMTATASA
jgi:hypothetical protein